MQLLNEAQVFETWSPILEEKTGITDSNKLKWMSTYAHYHSLNEGFSYPQASLFNTPGMGNVAPGTVAGGANAFYTGDQGSGDKFPSLLPLAIQVAARTVGFDIVPVIPMNGPSGVLTYLDYVYAGGRDVNAPGVAGQGAAMTNAAKFKDKFTVFKLQRSGLAAAVNTDLLSAVAGDIYHIGTAATILGAGVKSLKVAFVGKSRIDGSWIFRALAETENIVTTVDLTLGETQGVSYYEYMNDTVGATFGDAAGALIGGANASDVNAELVRGLEDHIAGFAGAGPDDDQPFSGNSINGRVAYEPMRRGIGETSYYRTMGLQAFTKFVEAETYQVAAQVTTEQIQDLNRQYGIDVVSMMENALVNDVSQSINKHILSRAFQLGWHNHFTFYTVEGTNLNLNLYDGSAVNAVELLGKDNGLYEVPVSPFQSYGPAGATFENQGTAQRRIQSKVLAAGNVIAQRGRRGPGNFVVTNLQIATALQDSAQFTFYPLANTVNQNNGALYPLGTIAGMTVYVDPNMDYNDTRVLCGRKGADEEPGLKFMPYLMAESIQTIAEGTMSPKIAVKSRYALVEAGFHPETQYFTFVVNLRDGDPDWHLATTSISIA